MEFAGAVFHAGAGHCIPGFCWISTPRLFRPLIFAGVIAYLFYPLVALVQRRFKLNRKTASRIVYFVSLAVMIILPIILVPILWRQTSEITQDLQQTLADAQQYLNIPISIAGIPIDLGRDHFPV